MNMFIIKHLIILRRLAIKQPYMSSSHLRHLFTFKVPAKKIRSELMENTISSIYFIYVYFSVISIMQLQILSF